MSLRRLRDGYDPHRGSQPLLRPTYFWRGVGFLLISLAGFVLANAFWHYVSTGTWVDFRPSAYRRDVTTLLSQSFLQPLSVFHYPWMLLVGPLVLAVMIFVPVIVAVLYRLGFAFVFVLAVAAVGHCPVLALVLAGGCILAAYTPLRSDASFLAFLLGMAPVTAYLVVTALLSSASAQPLQRWVPLAPFPGAMVVAVLAAAAVLGLARLIGYRPGVVWPVVAVLSAPPVAIFFTQIGAHELDYCLLARTVDGGDALFKPASVDDWAVRSGARGLEPAMQMTQAREELQARTLELIQRCERFLEAYPSSSHRVELAWMIAHCQALRVDEPAFQIGLLKYRDVHSLDSEPARKAWQRLMDEYPAQPQANLAEFRLGERACREGQLARGIDMVRNALAKLRAYVKAQDRSGEAEAEEAIFKPMPAWPSLQHYRDAVYQAARLVWLIDENRCLSDPLSAQALGEYLAVSPYDVDRYQRLYSLAGKYEQTPLGDNLKLAVALATADVYERAQALIVLAGSSEDSDARIEANYELGQLARAPALAPALPLLQDLRPPQWYYNVVRSGRASPWKELAAEHLAAIQRTTATREKP